MMGGKEDGRGSKAGRKRNETRLCERGNEIRKTENGLEGGDGDEDREKDGEKNIMYMYMY